MADLFGNMDTNAVTDLWKALAFERIRFLAHTAPAFSTDDIWPVLEGLQPPDDSRTLGAVLNDAVRRKLIRKSDFTTTSKRPICHARPIAVWQSIPLSGTDADAAAYVTARKTTLTAPSFDDTSHTATLHNTTATERTTNR